MVSYVLLLEQVETLRRENMLESEVGILEDPCQRHSFFEEDSPQSDHLVPKVEHKVEENIHNVEDLC